MSLEELLAGARQRLPLLQESSPLSQFTTPPQAPVSPQTPSAPQNPTPVIQQPSVAPVPQEAPLDALRQHTQQQMGALAFAPSSQMPQDQGSDLLRLALGPIMNGGQGGTGSPQGDIERAINITAHGISSGTSSIPSGGPTSSVDYASLPGMYGRLVDPPGGPSDLRLQQGAFQSLHKLGFPMSGVGAGSYRTNALQAQRYAEDPQRFAPPGMSLHEYGLAIDVHENYLYSPGFPQMRAKMLANGWYQERSDEPWHFSYGVFSPAPSGPQGGQERDAGRSSASSSRARQRPTRVRGGPRRI